MITRRYLALLFSAKIPWGVVSCILKPGVFEDAGDAVPIIDTAGLGGKKSTWDPW
eukprot:CAMPEP_0117838480 /NCGR_PEP_ID=MMETSP0949-20121206/13381_1 /TAXON_ID=44440 /ORGANISM="Chattonella subsalsa, Strain CCMP2191" /LENGTH=54 /DNA_ID=CAMNT_0005681219 /DNA_START=247 /DNA_END=408 /DNA_ORIENTATION=-